MLHGDLCFNPIRSYIPVDAGYGLLHVQKHEENSFGARSSVYPVGCVRPSLLCAYPSLPEISVVHMTHCQAEGTSQRK